MKSEIELRPKSILEERGLSFKKTSDGRLVFQDENHRGFFVLRRERDGMERKFYFPLSLWKIPTPVNIVISGARRTILEAIEDMETA